MLTVQIELAALKASSVDFSGNDLVVTMTDGRRISTPIEWYPRLANASDAQRRNFEIMPLGIYWPELDEDLSIQGMLEGRRVTSDVIKR